MKICIGLTGGIASGKSTVLQYFADKGYLTFSADAIAKQLTMKNASAWRAIVEHFGKQVLQENQELNRKYLRDIIFNDPKQKLWLEKTLHPAIRSQLRTLIAESTATKIITEIPLLTNRNDYPELTHVIAVITPLQQQIQRVMLRDNCTEKQAIAIINNQPSPQNYQDLADYILLNDGNIDELKNKVDDIISIL
jgi:dephospho-CoA kinase